MSDHLQLFLSKLLPLAVLPEGILTLALVSIVISAWLDAYRLMWMISALALAIFWISANPFVANQLMATLESQHPIDPNAQPRADVAIVLGGAVYNPSPPRQEPELGEAVDRVWHAARLYRSGQIAKILVVGGNLPWWPGAHSEAALIHKLLVELGVPASSIQIGGTSRNTFENAVEAKALMQAQPFESALLITSAWHMPPAPCDFRTNDELSGTLLDWVPNAQAFAMTSAALREWMGFYVYRWRGWL